MIIGINQNLAIMGREFHVQTEVIPGDEERVRTTVYVGGKIIGQRESELPADLGSDDEVREKMRAQHDMIIGNMVRRMEEMAAAKAAPDTEARTPAEPPGPFDEVRLPTVDDDPRLRSSLQVRRLLCPFWRVAGQDPPADHDALVVRLARLAALIGEVVASPIFPSLRVEEQVRFNILLDRMGAWLADDSEQDPETGSTLLAQVSLFSAHIGDANNRRELLAYDRQLLRWAIVTISGAGMSSEAREQLDTLYGCDPELDSLIAGNHEVSREQWLQALDRVLASR